MTTTVWERDPDTGWFFHATPDEDNCHSHPPNNLLYDDGFRFQVNLVDMSLEVAVCMGGYDHGELPSLDAALHYIHNFASRGWKGRIPDCFPAQVVKAAPSWHFPE